MAEKAPDENKKPVQTVVNKTDLDILQDVGRKLGIGVSVLKNEGETYIEGQKDKVREGGAYVAITGGSGKNNDLAEFWNLVTQKRTS